MRIALINPPDYTSYSQPPMGLALLAAVLLEKGHTVKIIDGNVQQRSLKELSELAYGSDVTGITATTSTITTALEIAYHLRCTFTAVPVILGGPHATLLPTETLKESMSIAAIVRGEGESAIINLLNAIEQAVPLAGIPNVSYRNGGEIIDNPCRTRFKLVKDIARKGAMANKPIKATSEFLITVIVTPIAVRNKEAYKTIGPYSERYEDSSPVLEWYSTKNRYIN